MIVLEIGVELGGDEPVLGEALPCPLPLEDGIAHRLLVEEDQRFGRQAAVLGAAEGEHVDAGPPGDIGRRNAQRDNRIGKPCPIHVDGAVVGMGDVGNRTHLVRTVGRTQLGQFGEADRDRLAAVGDMDRHGLELRRKRLRRELAGFAVERGQRDAAAEERGGARLVDRDMGMTVAEDDAARPRIGGKRQGIGDRAAADQQHGYLTLEELGETALDGLGEVVGAIGGMAVSGRFGERVDDFP